MTDKNISLTIRRFNAADAPAVSKLIRTTMDITNRQDYPDEMMDALIAAETPEHILDRAGWTHFYVVLDGERIIGSGAIGPYWNREDESCLFSIFVLPEHQGKGVGRRIIETLEQDEFFLRARRTEVPASLTGVPFYIRMGYQYKEGNRNPDERLLVKMEKKRG